MKSVLRAMLIGLLFQTSKAKAQMHRIDYALLNSFLQTHVDTSTPIYYLKQVKETGVWEFDRMHLQEKYGIDDKAYSQLKLAFERKCADTLWDCDWLPNAKCLTAKDMEQTLSGELKLTSRDPLKRPIIWEMSEPVYDHMNRFGLIYIGYSCVDRGGMCGYYAVYLLKKEGHDQWRYYNILGFYR